MRRFEVTRTFANRPVSSLYARSWLIVLLALLSACGTSLPTPQPATWTLAASSSAWPLADDLASAYQAALPNVDVDLFEVGNSLAAAEAVRTARADAAIVTLLPDDDHADLLATQIATDTVALIVNPDNPLESLTAQQAQAIFAGKVRDWSELGADEGTIDLVSRETGSGLRAAFEASVMQGRPISAIALLAPGHREMVEQISKNPKAIGYLPAAWLSSEVKAVAIDGVRPERQAQPSLVYPLQLPVYLLTPREATADVMRFGRYAASSAGRKIVARRYWPTLRRP